MEDFETKNKKRASRRHHMSRMKQKAINKLSRWGYSSERAIKEADHLANCSCSMCSNPRREFRGKKNIELTLHERKIHVSYE